MDRKEFAMRLYSAVIPEGTAPEDIQTLTRPVTEAIREMIALRNNIIAASKERIAVAKQVKEDLRVVKIKFPWC
jgi:hypothetical protein